MAETTSTRRSSWATWGLWILVSTAGWAAGTFLFLAMMRQGGLIASLIGLGLFGAIVGLAQWAILRLQIGRAGWWVLASAVGIIIGAVACLLLILGVNFLLERLDVVMDSTGSSRLMVIALAGILLGALFGALVGVAQSMALPWHVRDTGRWVLASILGGIFDGVLIGNLLWIVGIGIIPTNTFADTIALALTAAFGGPLKGIATGLALIWLLEEHPRDTVGRPAHRRSR